MPRESDLGSQAVGRWEAPPEPGLMAVLFFKKIKNFKILLVLIIWLA